MGEGVEQQKGQGVVLVNTDVVLMGALNRPGPGCDTQ